MRTPAMTILWWFWQFCGVVGLLTIIGALMLVGATIYDTLTNPLQEDYDPYAEQ